MEIKSIVDLRKLKEHAKELYEWDLKNLQEIVNSELNRRQQIRDNQVKSIKDLIEKTKSDQFVDETGYKEFSYKKEELESDISKMGMESIERRLIDGQLIVRDKEKMFLIRRTNSGIRVTIGIVEKLMVDISEILKIG